ncbi:MAG TPA: ATP-binding protein [Candidatus Acidoferrum sp.]|nr:ATP-binding protein [Candidatus Acidoferrum sp.]
MKQTRIGRTARGTTRSSGDARAEAGLRASGRNEDGFDLLFETSGEALAILSTQGVLKCANRKASALIRFAGPLPKSAGINPQLQNAISSLALKGTRREASRKEAKRNNADERRGATALRVTLRAILPDTGDLLVCLEDGVADGQGEESWEQTKAERDSLLEGVEAGVLLLDAMGGVRGTNARFARLFSLDERETEKLARLEEIEELVKNRLANPAAFSAPKRAFERGDFATVEDEMELAHPARRVLKRHARPVFDNAKRVVGLLELFTDVTSEKQIQTKWIQTEKMAALGQLVSGIAHELNNPLTGIMGYAQLLLGQNLPPVQRSEAEKVREEAERARHIVKNLLYFARESKPEHTRVNLNEIVERTLALRSYELKVENIAVECELAENLAETTADSHQLQQVVLNLIVNAEQALLESRGHGRITLRTRQTSSKWIAMEVSDDGPGIPGEILHRVFDPFFTTKPPGSGTGLGLSIVYGIVRQHEGEVTAENLPEGGARFTVELPVLAVAENTSATSDSRPENFRGRNSAGRVLVVEDEPTVAQLIVDVLGEEGYTTEAVLDSQEGLTMLSRREFDLVICDLRMPRLDGPAFYEALVRAGSPLQHAVLFITGDTLARRTQEFLEGRRLPYLAKPFLVEELKLAVNRLVESSASSAGGTNSNDLLSEAASS